MSNEKSNEKKVTTVPMHEYDQEVVFGGVFAPEHESPDMSIEEPEQGSETPLHIVGEPPKL